MTKDEALDLALEVLESVLANHNGAPVMPWIEARDAIKQARALDKKAENARALGLDYEPVGWWDAKIGFFEEKHFDQLQPLYTTPPAQPAPVQEPVAIPEYIRDAAKHLHENRFEPSFMVRAIVGWINGSPPAQPAVPDAIGPNEDELPAYAAGWNDCRQTMLEMMKARTV
jgi:hypothetical protein